MNKILLKDTVFSKNDDRLDLRLPKILKRELLVEAKSKGYKNLSQYLFMIILGRTK